MCTTSGATSPLPETSDASNNLRKDTLDTSAGAQSHDQKVGMNTCSKRSSGLHHACSTARVVELRYTQLIPCLVMFFNEFMFSLSFDFTVKLIISVPCSASP